MRSLKIALMALALSVCVAPRAFAQTTTSTSSSTSSTSSSTSTSTSSTSSTSTSTLPAVTWAVLRNSDCTADIAATGVTSAVVNCCTALGNGQCERRENWGALFVQNVTLVTAAGQAYTSGGDLINAANLTKIGIGNIVWFQCGASTAGHSVRVNFTTASGKRAPKVLLFNGTTQITTATNIGNIAVDCLVYGY